MLLTKVIGFATETIPPKLNEAVNKFITQKVGDKYVYAVRSPRYKEYVPREFAYIDITGRSVKRGIRSETTAGIEENWQGPSIKDHSAKLNENVDLAFRKIAICIIEHFSR